MICDQREERRVLLNSTTQDRTPCGALLRMAGLILDRVDGTLRCAFLISLIGCNGFRVAVLLTTTKTSGRNNHPHSRARMPHGNNAGTLRGRRDGNYSPSLLSGRYPGVGSH